MITRGVGAGWLAAARVALTPAPAPWARGGALVAFVAAAGVAAGGDALGELTVVGVAFFGAACAAVFVSRGPYRQRAALLAGQASGACLGIGIGTACTSGLSRLVAAIAVAAVAGLIGTAGGAATAGSLMAVIGVGFGEFGRVDLSGLGQVGAYLSGTAAVALAIAGAVAAAPKLYAFAVVGVTCGALLSASIPAADRAGPLLRVADTALGAAIAIVFGYLLWPGRGLPEPELGVARAVAAARAYLSAVENGDPDLRVVRDRAYATAHRARATAQSALADPPPVAALAARQLPRAMELERLVDAVTAYDRGDIRSTEHVAELRQRLADAGQLSARPKR